MKAWNRRAVLSSAATTAGVSILTPAWSVLAAPQRRADLVVDTLQWSEDAGITFTNDPVLVGSDVVFEALVSNRGKASASPSFVVGFHIDGGLVATSAPHSGLAAGASVKLRAASGQVWTPGAADTHTARAHADVNDVVREMREGNNTLSREIVVEQPPNEEIIANNDTASTDVDTLVNIDVLANDTGPQGQTLRVLSVQSPTDQGGIAVITANGLSIDYTPPSGFTGQDTFTYEVGI